MAFGRGGDRQAEAVEALEAFWGRSNGGDVAYRELSERLSALKLSGKDLARLRLNLPVPESAAGTTAAKIQRAAQCLELLELG